MVIYLQRMFFLMIFMLVKDVFCAELMMPSKHQIALGQLIILPPKGEEGGSVYGNCCGQYPIYPFYAKFYRHSNVNGVEEDIIFFKKYSEKKEEETFTYNLTHPANSFLFLVTAEKLDNDALLMKKDIYHGINRQDRYGNTALHLLVMRPDATIEQLESLLQKGADPEISAGYYKDTFGNTVQGPDVYRNGVMIVGRSPLETPKELNPYYGNKTIMKYLFNYMLEVKLKRYVETQQRKMEAQGMIRNSFLESFLSKKLDTNFTTYISDTV